MSCCRIGGFWVSKCNRMLTVHELAALQGLPRLFVDKMLGISTTTNVGGAIGDAMSINVLMRLLPHVLRAAGLLATWEKKNDIWQHASQTVGQMPEALYIKKGALERLRQPTNTGNIM